VIEEGRGVERRNRGRRHRDKMMNVNLQGKGVLRGADRLGNNEIKQRRIRNYEMKLSIMFTIKKKL